MNRYYAYVLPGVYTEIHAPDKATARAHTQQLLEALDGDYFEFRFSRKDGGDTWFLGSFFALDEFPDREFPEDAIELIGEDIKP